MCGSGERGRVVRTLGVPGVCGLQVLPRQPSWIHVHRVYTAHALHEPRGLCLELVPGQQHAKVVAVHHTWRKHTHVVGVWVKG